MRDALCSDDRTSPQTYAGINEYCRTQPCSPSCHRIFTPVNIENVRLAIFDFFTQRFITSVRETCAVIKEIR